MFLEVDREGKVTYTKADPADMDPAWSCVLDVAARGPTLEEVGDYFGVSRERIRQIEAKALDHFRIQDKRRGEVLAAIAAEPFASELATPSPWDPEPSAGDDGERPKAGESTAAKLRERLQTENRTRRTGPCPTCKQQVTLDRSGVTRAHAEPFTTAGVVRKVCPGSGAVALEEGRKTEVDDWSSWKSKTGRAAPALGGAMGPGLREREKNGLGLWGHARGPIKVPFEVEEARRAAIAAAAKQAKGPTTAAAVAAVAGCSVVTVWKYAAELAARGVIRVQQGKGIQWVGPGGTRAGKEADDHAHK